jgi:acylphosphatase
VRRRCVVRGHVQGVFFRGSTQEAAVLAGAAGWVRNRDDGSVEAVVEGTAAAVEQVVDFCHRGPRWARVDAVELSDEPPEGLRDFQIL